MHRNRLYLLIPLCIIIFAGCFPAYKTKPVSFRLPESYNNAVNVAAAKVAAHAYADRSEAKKAFGFDILGAGMLPVELIFDNRGANSLVIDGTQTFLEDKKGNLWPVLSKKIAHERATKYAKTKEIFKEGAYKGFLGAAAGSIIGAAIGIVTGENVAEAAGKGAAAGAAVGATIGGIAGYASDDARRQITIDLHERSLQNRAVEPKSLAYGFLFFPGEAGSAKRLRVRLLEEETENVHIIMLDL